MQIIPNDIVIMSFELKKAWANILGVKIRKIAPTMPILQSLKIFLRRRKKNITLNQKVKKVRKCLIKNTFLISSIPDITSIKARGNSKVTP